MKRVIFLVVALASMLAYLLYTFDNSFFQEEVEKPKHQLIYDLNYNFDNPLVASTQRHGRVVYDTILFRDIVCRKINDSLKIEMGKGFFSWGNFTYTFKVNLGIDSSNISAARHSCTYYDEYTPIRSKIILNRKKTKVGDSIAIYFDIFSIHKEAIGEFDVQDTLKLDGAIKVMVKNANFTEDQKRQENDILEIFYLSENYPDTTHLSVRATALDSIPNEIVKLKNLKTLDLSENNIPLSEFEKLGVLQNLERLYIRKNNLKTLPLFILKLRKLEYLDISDNQLTSFPRELSKLSSLKELRIKGNNIRNCKTKIKQLKKLERSDFFTDQ